MSGRILIADEGSPTPKHPAGPDWSYVNLHLGQKVRIDGRVSRVQDAFWERIYKRGKVPPGWIAVQTCTHGVCVLEEHLCLIKRPVLPAGTVIVDYITDFDEDSDSDEDIN
jgi:hypothetical protein